MQLHPHVGGLRHKLTAKVRVDLHLYPHSRTVKHGGGGWTVVTSDYCRCPWPCGQEALCELLGVFGVASVRGTTNFHHRTSFSLSLSTHSCSHRVGFHMGSAHDFLGKPLTTWHWLTPREGTLSSKSGTWSSAATEDPLMEQEEAALGHTVTLDFTVGDLTVTVFHCLCSMEGPVLL